jgi:prepilin-type N-terminal cleavage/methylation domain-containing protein
VVHPRGFVLLEVMLAVGIFSIGIIALGQCVDNCLRSQAAINQSQKARLALENRMAQIEAGEVQIGDEKTEDLKGMFAGMKMRQKRAELKAENENKEKLNGLYEVTVEVEWLGSNGDKQTSELKFIQLAIQQ